MIKKAKFCLFCKHHHFGSEHEWGNERTNKVMLSGMLHLMLLSDEILEKSEDKPDSKPKFDRTAYQREYMRKWRAKK